MTRDNRIQTWPAVAPVAIGSEPQLFIDNIFFDRNPDLEAWDRAMTWIGSTLPVDGELYIYYGGYKHGHKIEPTRERQLGLAKMRWTGSSPVMRPESGQGES